MNWQKAAENAIETVVNKYGVTSRGAADAEADEVALFRSYTILDSIRPNRQVQVHSLVDPWGYLKGR